MALCRRNLLLKLLKAMVEENDVLNQLYGDIIMRKIQLSKRKHKFGVFYYLVKELQLDQNKQVREMRQN